MHLLTKTLGVMGCVGLTCFGAQGAAITWSGATFIANENVIQANVSSAFNLRDQTVNSVVTANGSDVTFVSVAGGADIVSGGVTLSRSGGFNSGASVNAWTGPPTDADFNTVMDSFSHTPAASPATATITLSGLTAGTQYSVQLFVSDIRNNIGNKRTIGFNDGVGNATAEVGQNSSPSFIGTFTADVGGVQTINAFSNGFNGGTSGSAILNAVTLAVVPEPGSLALLGLGGLLLARRRR